MTSLLFFWDPAVFNVRVKDRKRQREGGKREKDKGQRKDK